MQHTVVREWSCARLGDQLIGPAELIQAPQDLFDWEAIEADKGTTYLLNLIDPRSFYDRCPDHWQRPMQLTPMHGVPKSVWLGIDFGAPFTDLLDVWPTRRFVLITGKEDPGLLQHILGFVRCTNCGTRYDAPTKLCMRRQLCGDAKIAPQIEVFTGPDSWAKEQVLELRGRWLSWQ